MMLHGKFIYAYLFIERKYFFQFNEKCFMHDLYINFHLKINYKWNRALCLVYFKWTLLWIYLYHKFVHIRVCLFGPDGECVNVNRKLDMFIKLIFNDIYLYICIIILNFQNYFSNFCIELFVIWLFVRFFFWAGWFNFITFLYRKPVRIIIQLAPSGLLDLILNVQFNN